MFLCSISNALPDHKTVNYRIRLNCDYRIRAGTSHAFDLQFHLVFDQWKDSQHNTTLRIDCVHSCGFTAIALVRVIYISV